MKNKIIAACASLVLATSANAANVTKESTHLTVVNNWSKTIHVKEGRILKTDEDVFSGRMLDKSMFSGFITNLSITYKKDGVWTEIPGCPTGMFYQSVHVYISYSPFDPNLPECRMI